jgi:hypothetical protein
MAMELVFEPREGYLYATITGQFELAAAEAATARLLQGCVDRQQPKALVDIRRVQGHISDTQRFRYSETVATQVAAVGQAAGGPLRLAYLGWEPVIDAQRFGVTVAYNRGVRILVTDSLDEALAWLTG